MSTIALILLPFVVLTVHRMWNYEHIFLSARLRLRDWYVANCPSCNAWWIALFCTLWARVSYLPVLEELYFASAVYCPARLLISLLAKYQPSRSLPIPPTPLGVSEEVAVTKKPKKEGCKSCGTAEELKAKQAHIHQFPNRLLLIIDRNWGTDTTSLKFFDSIDEIALDPAWYLKIIVHHDNDVAALAEMLDRDSDRLELIRAPKSGRLAGWIKREAMIMGRGVMLSYHDQHHELWEHVCPKLAELRAFTFRQIAGPHDMRAEISMASTEAYKQRPSV